MNDPRPWIGTTSRNLAVLIEDEWGTEHVWFGPSFEGRVDADTRARVMAKEPAVAWTWAPREAW